MLNINRSNLYYKPIINNDDEIANMIQEIYLSSDCRYGYRKIGLELSYKDIVINLKKVFRLMKDMGIKGLYPRRRPNTSNGDSEHRIYPYLLHGLSITKVNQVWATDITYISIGGKFVYFMAIIDLFSRYIVDKKLSLTLDSSFCIDILNKALNEKGSPEIFNTDQGSQFTSAGFTDVLKGAGISISMDHKGRCFDNIFIERFWRTLKQEAIYFYRPNSIEELDTVLEDFIGWYNYQRRHQSLQYKIPAEVYYGS